MSLYAAAMLTFSLLALIGFLFALADHDKPLPKPRADERSWSINYMTDFKRWTEK